MKSVTILAVVITFSSSAFAAGIDSRTYTCADLHALITANRFIFIGNPDFQDFVVSDVSQCPGGAYDSYIQFRSVATRDRPECPVPYCMAGRASDSKGQ